MLTTTKRFLGRTLLVYMSGHPSAADEAWYWQKCALRIG